MRIRAADETDPAVRAALDQVRTRWPVVPHLFGVLAHLPAAMKGVGRLGEALLFNGTLPADLREAAILRVAARTGCDYETQQHVAVSKDLGLSDGLVARTLDVDRPVDGGDELSLVLAAIDAAHRDDDLTDDLWAALEQRFGPEQLVELLLLIGYYRMLALLLNASRTPLEAPGGVAPRWNSGPEAGT